MSCEPLAPELAISVQNVSKAYDLYASPVDRLKELLWHSKERARRFWALKHVSFELKRGEALGIIGRNGSGKSTLLQIIAGTLAPTSGRVLVRGRVSALLELGSGFNPRFTGRENVFLAGAILGFTKREMEAKFDDIASFADIGEFLDQPISVYSSGMHSRLAFAVAVSVQPDVLILDEVLSVGDAEFQSRCVARMRKLLDTGVTLLFVSHHADSVKSICRKGLFLRRGHEPLFGGVTEAVDHYYSHMRDVTNRRAVTRAPVSQPAEGDAAAAKATAELRAPADAPAVPASLRYGSGHALVEAVRVLDSAGRGAEAYGFNDEIVLEADIRAAEDLDRLDVAFLVRDRSGVDLIGTSAHDEGASVPPLKAGEGATVRFAFRNILRPGNYGVSITLSRRPTSMGDGLLVLDHLDACGSFTALAARERRIRHKVHVDVGVEVRTCERVNARE